VLSLLLTGGAGLLKHWRPILIGLLALGVVTGISLGYRHYTGLLSTVQILTANEAKWQLDHDIQSATITAQEIALEDWKLAQEAWVATVASMQTLNTTANAENRRLNDIFSKHDFGRLALGRPTMVEKRINDGTVDALRMLECASGAVHEDCTDHNSKAEPSSQPATPNTN